MAEKVTSKQSGNIVRRGNGWAVRIRHKGKQIWRSAPTKTLAQKILGELRNQIEREDFGLPKRQQALTLREWAPRFLEWSEANKRSWKNDVTKMNRWLAFGGDRRLPQVDREFVSGFITLRQGEGISGATINRDIACLRRALSLAVEEGELDVNRLLGFHQLREAPARQPSLSKDEETRVIAGARPWMAWMIRLALATGARAGELIALRWRDIDFDVGVIVIRDSKSGESRRLPIPASLREEMKSRHESAASDRENKIARGIACPDLTAWPVVPGYKGDCVTVFTVSFNWQHVRAKINRPDLRFHDLRHVAASRLLAQGATLPEVAAWLGHKTLAMSRRYSHVSWERLSEMVNGASRSGV